MEDKLKRLRTTFDQALFPEDHFTEKSMDLVKKRMAKHNQKKSFHLFQKLANWHKPILGAAVCLVLLVGAIYVVHHQGDQRLNYPGIQSGDAFQTVATFDSGAPGAHGADIGYTKDQLNKVALAVKRSKASILTYLPTVGVSDDYLMEVRINSKKTLVQLVYPHFSIKMSNKAFQPLGSKSGKRPAKVDQGKGTWFTSEGGIEALQVHLNSTYILIDSSKMVNPYSFVDISNSLISIDKISKHQDTKLVEKYPNAPGFVLQAVGESVGKKPEELTEDDLLTLTELSIPSGGEMFNGQYDLSIIGEMKNLTSLSIFVSYKDPKFLNELHQLKSLSIQKPSPAMLPDFRSLTSLETLELTEGNIEEISFLKELPNLKVLNLQNNHVEELKDVAGLKHLETLNVRGNSLVNLAPIKNLVTLKELDVSENWQLTSLDPIANLKQLIRLSARNNNIRSTTPLNGLLDLQVVDLNNNPVSSLDFLKGNKALDTLLIQGTNVGDLTVLKDMPKLRLLDIRRSKVNSVSILKNLPGLQVLELNKDQVKDWELLKGNKDLVISEDTYLG